MFLRVSALYSNWVALARDSRTLVYAPIHLITFIYLINRCAKTRHSYLPGKTTVVVLLSVIWFLLDGADGDVKMCESESKDGFDELDDLPRKPFVRVSAAF